MKIVLFTFLIFLSSFLIFGQNSQDSIRVATPIGHTAPITSAVFSPDGNLILTASWDHSIRLWDKNSGKLLMTFIGHTGVVSSAVFSPDGKQVLSASWDNTARLWEISSGETLRIFEGHSSYLETAVFSPDGKMVLTASGDKTAKLWETTSGLMLHSFEGHTEILRSAVFSPDGRQILTASMDNTARSWDAQSGRVIQILEHTNDFGVQSAVFSPDKKNILTSSWSLQRWDSASGDLLSSSTAHLSGFISAIYSPDGAQLLALAENNTMSLIDAHTGENILSVGGHTDRITSAVFSPDGKQILSSSWDNTVRLWDIDRETVVKFLDFVDKDNVSNIGIHADKRVAGASFEMNWNRSPTEFIDQACFGFNDELLAISAWGDNKVYLWNVRSRKLIRILKSSFVIRNIAFSEEKKCFFFESNEIVLTWSVNDDDEVLMCDRALNEYYFNQVKPKEKIAFYSYSDGGSKIVDDEMSLKFISTYNQNNDIDSWRSIDNEADSIQFLYDGWGSQIIVLDSRKRVLLNESFEEPGFPACEVVFSNDLRKFCVLRLYCATDMPAGENTVLLYDHSNNPNTLFSLSPSSLIQNNIEPFRTGMLISCSQSEVSYINVKRPENIFSVKMPGIIYSVSAGKDNIYLMVHDSSYQKDKYAPALQMLDSSFNVLDIISSKGSIREMNGSVQDDPDLNYIVGFDESADGRFLQVRYQDGIDIYSTETLEIINSYLFDSTSVLHDRNSIYPIENKTLSSGQKSVFYSSENGVKELNILNFQESEISSIYDPKIIYKDIIVDESGFAVIDDGRIITFDFKKNSVKTLFWVNRVDFTHVSRKSDSEYLISFKSGNGGGVFLFKTSESQTLCSLELYYRFSSEFPANTYASNGVISINFDGHIDFYIEKDKEKLYSLIFLKNNNWLVKLPDSPYYMCTKNASRMLHYVTPDLKLIGFEQLDPVYNRPDIVLESIGKYFDGADQKLVVNYRQSWEKRIERLRLDREKLGKGELSVPYAEIVNSGDLMYENRDGDLEIKVEASDPKYLLQRFNVFVNEVPLYGAAGISIANLNEQFWDTTVTIPLSAGENKIQVSVMNELGLENFKYPTYVNYKPAQSEDLRSRTFFIGIGVNDFLDTSIADLRYCVKDIQDLARSFSNGKSNVTNLFLTDTSVTRQNILKLKEFLRDSTKVDDKVIISCSSHGFLVDRNDRKEFYLAMYDTEAAHPEQKGLFYDELAGLLDSIPARQKLLLIDACNSGENDAVESRRGSGGVAGTKENGRGAQAENIGSSGNSSFETMMELFVNVSNPTGAVIISAAGGQQSALEAIQVNGKTIENGAFTYCVLEYLRNYRLKPNALTVNELKRYVEDRVVEITDGKQKPTSRQETMEVDWRFR